MNPFGTRPGMEATMVSGFEEFDTLAPRLLHLLPLLADAATNQEMAEVLTLDIKTIEQYVSDIYSHVNIHDRTKLVLRIKEWQDWKSTQSGL